MPSLNKVFIMGNITRDPALRYTPRGSAICEFGVAVNRRYTTENGEQKDEVCFIDVDVWAKQAENCGKYLQKGSPVFIEGRLRTDSWEDKEGKKRSRLKVTAERVQFLSGPGGRGGAPTEDNEDPAGQPAPQQQQRYPSHPSAPRQQPYPQAQAPQQAPQERQPPPPAAPQQQHDEPPPMPPPEAFSTEGETEDDIPF